MKKIISISVLILAFSAAPLFAVGFDFGIKGGLNRGIYTNWDVDSTDYRTGIMFGFLFDFRFGPISLQPELMYVEKSTEATDGNLDAEIYVDEIEVPLLVKVNLFGIPYIYAGPALGFPVDAQQEITDRTTGQSQTIDISDDVENVELSFVGGFGVKVWGVLLEFRYSQGLKRIFTAGDLEDVRTRYYGVMVGYQFNITE